MGAGSWVEGGFIEALERNAERLAAKPALRQGDRSLSYADLLHRSRAAGLVLQDLGVSPGDRVAIMMRNCPELFELYFGAILCGAAIVPLNYRASAVETENVLGDVDPAAIVLADEFHPQASGDWKRNGVPNLRLGDTDGGVGSFRGRLEKRLGGTPVHAVCVDDLLAVLLTGGTTGRPKGVKLTHSALATSIANEIEGVGLGPETLVAAMPLFHVGIVHPLCVLVQGGTVVLHARVDIDEILEAIAAHQATMTVLLPTSVGELVERKLERGGDTSSLKFLLYGAAPMHPGTAAKAVEQLGQVLVGVYGLTEGGGAIFSLDREDHDPSSEVAAGRLRSIGRPFPGVEAACWDESGAPVGGGAVGELVVSSGSLMSGYWGNPDLSEQVLDSGWLRTGDLAYRDEDGYYFLVDRKKNMIITGGENVYPQEVEEVLLTHPQVREAAVIGMPDSRWGEAVTAFIRLEEGASTAPDDLIAHCERTLARYKKPRAVIFVEELPKTAVGKLDKKALRDEFA